MLIEISSRKRPLDASRRTALIVEDDPRLQRAMSRELAGMDFRVLSASHYDGAVRHLAQLEPHLVCIDVGLPNKSGYELCEHIRGPLGLARLPILMMSDYGGSADKAHAEEAGGNGFLLKPFSMPHFKQCVESLSKGHRPSAPVQEPLDIDQEALLGHTQMLRDLPRIGPMALAHVVHGGRFGRRKVHETGAAGLR